MKTPVIVTWTHRPHYAMHQLLSPPLLLAWWSLTFTLTFTRLAFVFAKKMPSSSTDSLFELLFVHVMKIASSQRNQDSDAATAAAPFNLCSNHSCCCHSDSPSCSRRSQIRQESGQVAAAEWSTVAWRLSQVCFPILYLRKSKIQCRMYFIGNLSSPWNTSEIRIIRMKHSSYSHTQMEVFLRKYDAWD